MITPKTKAKTDPKPVQPPSEYDFMFSSYFNDEKLEEAMKLVRGLSRLPLTNDPDHSELVREAFLGTGEED